MNKILRTFFAGFASLISLAGCGNNNNNGPIKLTYGSKIQIDTSVEEKEVIRSFKITSTDLDLMMQNNESFLLFTYSSFSDEEVCGCLLTSGSIIRQLTNKYNYRFYCLETYNLDEKYVKNTLGFDKSSISARICIFQGKNRRAMFSYGSSQDTALFHNVDKFNEMIVKWARKPSLYYVNEQYIDTNVVGHPNTENIIMYVWNSCDDCKYLLPKKVIPYVYENKTKDILVYDLDKIAKTDFSGEYARILSKYYVSDRGETKYHSDFGYDRGFVPTTQYWKNGELKDVNVYFNDETELNASTNKLKITRSFFTQERVNKLSYLSNVENKVLLGKEFGYENMEYTEKQKELAKLHDPLFDAFVKTYF